MKRISILAFCLAAGSILGNAHNTVNCFTFRAATAKTTKEVLHRTAVIEEIKRTHKAPQALISLMRKPAQIEEAWSLQPSSQISNIEGPITVFCSGFPPSIPLCFFKESLSYGEAFRAVHAYTRNNVIHTASVSYDNLDTHQNFDCGGTIRTTRLTSVLTEMCNHTDGCILMGDSLGAKTILNLNRPGLLKTTRAIVLQSPVFDFESILKNTQKAKVSWLNKGLFNKINRWFFSKYKPENDITLAKLKSIPKDIPIFIGHLHNDFLLSDAEILSIVKQLQENGNTVYLLVIDNPESDHSKIATTAPFVKAVNAFYKAHNLPYNEQLAEEGQELLAHAKENANENTINYIEKISRDAKK